MRCEEMVRQRDGASDLNNNVHWRMLKGKRRLESRGEKKIFVGGDGKVKGWSKPS
jgi:hypothetical protein